MAATENVLPISATTLSTIFEHRGPTRGVVWLANAAIRPWLRLAIRLYAQVHWHRALCAIAIVSDFLGAVMFPAPRRSRHVVVKLPCCTAEWVMGPGVSEPWPGGGAVLCFHGGGFVFGGRRQHRGTAARISEAAGVPVLNVAYRLIPQVALEGCVDDAVDAYRLMITSGIAPERIVTYGSSAGGFLAFAVPLAARDRGLPLPGAITAISPFLDFDFARRKRSRNRFSDSFFTPAVIESLVTRIISPNTLSPVDEDLTGLPPVLIQASTTELLIEDTLLMADRLAAAGVPTRVQLWDGLPHAWDVLGAVLSEARSSIADLGAFVRACITCPSGEIACGTEELEV